jgi:hypothetical protein
MDAACHPERQESTQSRRSAWASAAILDLMRGGFSELRAIGTTGRTPERECE